VKAWRHQSRLPFAAEAVKRASRGVAPDGLVWLGEPWLPSTGTPEVPCVAGVKAAITEEPMSPVAGKPDTPGAARKAACQWPREGPGAGLLPGWLVCGLLWAME
jgi:hypothetical protein